jgi:hypothetical protein
MNRDKVLMVADAIENATLAKDIGVGFNMRDFYDLRARCDQTGHSCGTTACTAGWAWLMFKDKDSIDHTLPDEIELQAAELLGLTEAEADNLFFGVDCGKRLTDITTGDAIKVLRHLADTGEVDWTIIEKETA